MNHFFLYYNIEKQDFTPVYISQYLNLTSIINCKQKQDCSNHRNITKKGTDFLISKYLNSANL